MPIRDAQTAQTALTDLADTLGRLPDHWHARTSELVNAQAALRRIAGLIAAERANTLAREAASRGRGGAETMAAELGCSAGNVRRTIADAPARETP